MNSKEKQECKEFRIEHEFRKTQIYYLYNVIFNYLNIIHTYFLYIIYISICLFFKFINIHYIFMLESY